MPSKQEANVNNSDKVWISPGTRLHMLVYNVYSQTWEVWTSTNSRNGSSKLWHGTFMELHSDGMCWQRFRSESEVRDLLIRPATPDKWEENTPLPRDDTI